MKRLFKSRALCSILAVLITATLALAQRPPPAGTQHPLTELLNAVKEMGDRVENIDILSRYCKPPMQPDKSGAEIDIGLESLLFRRLLRDFYRIEQSFTSGGSSPEASSYRASFPVIDGIIATDQNDGFEIRDDRRFIWTSDLEGLLSAEQFAVVELKTVGTHTITLTVTDDKGRTATDQLEVEVVAGATLQAGPTSLGLYSGGPQAERVWVESFPPEESLPWRAVAGDPWLRLGQTSGRTPAEIDVSYDSQLAAGQYWTILTLTSPEAPERSLTIEVWITIE